MTDLPSVRGRAIPEHPVETQALVRSTECGKSHMLAWAEEPVCVLERGIDPGFQVARRLCPLLYFEWQAHTRLHLAEACIHSIERHSADVALQNRWDPSGDISGVTLDGVNTGFGE